MSDLRPVVEVWGEHVSSPLDEAQILDAIEQIARAAGIDEIERCEYGDKDVIAFVGGDSFLDYLDEHSVKEILEAAGVEDEDGEYGLLVNEMQCRSASWRGSIDSGDVLRFYVDW